MGRLVRYISTDGTLTVMAMDSTDIVKTAQEIHSTTAVASAALGRTLTAASLMGSALKGKKDTVTLKINGGGPVGALIAVSDSSGNVRGYAQNGEVELVEHYPGKLNVGAAVGTNGFVTVIKDLGLKEPYVGQTPLVSGEIAEDVTAYYAASEQIPSAVALGVLLNPDQTVKAAGGFIMQLLPTATEQTAEQAEKCIAAMEPITALIERGMTPDDIVNHVMTSFEMELLDDAAPAYRCNCSRSRVEQALISVGHDELLEMAKEGNAEVNCQFCPKKYVFTPEELKRLAKR